jgi:hypothetical protein
LNFVHNAQYFTKKEILRRARKYEFPNPLAVEIFLWNCELAAQLQNACSDIVLKGGTAAQLHLPLEQQRGSIDIDVTTPRKKSEVGELVQKVSESLEESVKFRLHKPKKPIPKLPLVTYFAKTPTKLDLARKELEIKVDISLESPNLPSIVLKNVETFAVDVKRMKCLTAGTLIGDKLLTLAKGSVGMELEGDYPKQIYDIDALLETGKISKKFVNEMSTSVETLTRLEASYRNINTTPSDALRDVIKTMDEYSLVDTSGGSSSIKKNIEGFQQFFVNKNERKPLFGWSSKSLKIRFLAMLVREQIENRFKDSEVANSIIVSHNIVQRLDKISGPDVIELRKKLLSLAETKIEYFKEMKGKPLDRVFWQIVTPRNLLDVQSLIENF